MVRLMLLGLLLLGCTAGDAPLAPGECIVVHPDSMIRIEPGKTYCVTITVRRDTVPP